jgi:hypothetical protein
METIVTSSIFETILSLILIYALLSLLVSTLTEIVNKFVKARSRMLHETLTSFFNDNININFGHLLYNHPMIDNIKKNRFSFPQYISAEMFSTAFIDVVSNHAREFKFDAASNAIKMLEDNRNIFERFKNGIQKMEHTDLKVMFLNMIEKSHFSENKLECLRKELEKWYNDQMERTTGWYKNKISTRLRWVALFVAIGLNIDSVHLFQTILRTPQLRSELTGVATQVASNYENLKNDSSLTAIKKAYKAVELSKIKIDTTVNDSLYTSTVRRALLKIDSVNRIIDSEQSSMMIHAAGQMDQINTLGIPIGYRNDLPPVSWFRPDSLKPKMATGYFLYHQQATLPNVLIYLAGIIITMFSLSVGAPFWFDLLVKFVNLRKAGIKPSTDKKN